jgi:hypothetical protein
VADRNRQVEVGASAGGRGIGAALEIHHAAVDHVRKQNIPCGLGREEVSHGAGLVPYHEPSLDRLLEKLDPVRLGRRPDLPDQQVARGRDSCIADAALAQERLGEAALAR